LKNIKPESPPVVQLQWPPGTDISKLCTTPTIVVQPPAESSGFDRFAPTIPSLAVSVFAIGLTLWNLLYTQNKDRRAREISVRDDFWIRKVISPATIEPMMGYTNTLQNRFPSHPSATSPEDTLEIWLKEVGEFEALRHAFVMLQMLDEHLWEYIDKEFDQASDLIAEYFGELVASIQSPEHLPPNLLETKAKMQTISNRIFKRILEYQRSS
jgi:hypothetical protein